MTKLFDSGMYSLVSALKQWTPSHRFVLIVQEDEWAVLAVCRGMSANCVQGDEWAVLAVCRGVSGLC